MYSDDVEGHIADAVAEPNDDGRGAHLSNEQFAKWRTIVRERTGMILADDRRTFLVTKILSRMRAIGSQSFDEYYDYLTSGPRAFIEWTEFVDRITTHETRFFRDPIAFDYISNVVLPELSQRMGNLHVWSAGCSTGEEAYGLAIIIAEYARIQKVNLRFAITATDISLPCLSIARTGSYDASKVASLPGTYAARFFTRAGADKMVVNDVLMQRVCFAQMNLLESGTKPIGAMDIIYCQKVLIYLEQSVRHKMLDRMVLHLKPGGYLILGIGEVTGWKNSNVERVSGTNVLVFKSVVTG